MTATRYVLDPSNTEEYSILDLTVVAQLPSGAVFPFKRGDLGLLEDAMYDNKPESKTMQGSGKNPRAHLRILNKPTAELSMSINTATALEKFVGPDGQCKLLCSRRTPTGTIVADHVHGWKPLFGGPTYKGGDATVVKVTGNALRIDKDVRGAISSRPT